MEIDLECLGLGVQNFADVSWHLELNESNEDGPISSVDGAPASSVDGAPASSVEDDPTSSVDGASSVEDAPADWEIVKRCSGDTELVEYLYSLPYKMTATHGKQVSKCSLHTDGHKQLYGYYACSSVRCLGVQGDTCQFQLKVKS